MDSQLDHCVMQFHLSGLSITCITLVGAMMEREGLKQRLPESVASVSLLRDEANDVAMLSQHLRTDKTCRSCTPSSQHGHSLLARVGYAASMSCAAANSAVCRAICRQGLIAGWVCSPAKNSVPATGAARASRSPTCAPAYGNRFCAGASIHVLAHVGLQAFSAPHLAWGVHSTRGRIGSLTSPPRQRGRRHQKQVWDSSQYLQQLQDLLATDGQHVDRHGQDITYRTSCLAAQLRG